VQLCISAHESLAKSGVKSRVVSMPSWELFERQPKEYREQVLPPSIKKRISVEQGSTFGWDKYVGEEGRIIGMHTFGASAPLKALLGKFGFTAEAVEKSARELVGAEAGDKGSK